MSGALKTANDELLRQLMLGQRAVESSLQRVTGGVVPPSKSVRWRLNGSDEKENAREKEEIEPVPEELSSEGTAMTINSSAPSPQRRNLRAAEKRAPRKETKSKRDTEADNERKKEELLEAEGNQRRPRAKRSIDEVNSEDDEKGIRSILSRSGVQRRSTPSHVKFDTAGDPVRRSAVDSAIFERKSSPSSSLLGYDWIAGMVENCGKMEALNQSSEYFERLGRFRREHKEECVAREFRHESFIEDVVYNLKPGERVTLQPPPGQPSVEQIMDAKDCEEPVYAYTVNERLFPTPINSETEKRGTGTPDAPHILKVSIPSYRLLPSPSRLQPRRRRSIDDTDTFSLIGHCQVGYHPGPISAPAPARPADLASSTEKESQRQRPKQPRSEEEAVAQLRRSARPKLQIPKELHAPSHPRVIDALLARKELNGAVQATARSIPNPRRLR